jgi:hypothetical protein
MREKVSMCCQRALCNRPLQKPAVRKYAAHWLLVAWHRGDTLGDALTKEDPHVEDNRTGDCHRSVALTRHGGRYPRIRQLRSLPRGAECRRLPGTRAARAKG